MDFPQETSKEYMWCAKLDSKTKANQWEGRDDGIIEQIVLKRACLGVGAKDKERNIVQVTSFNSKQQKVECCICSLRAGLKEDESLSDLTILPPAIFKLIAGSGPVHLVGNHMVMEDLDEGSDDDMSDAELEDEQMGMDDEDSDEDDDEEEEEEEEDGPLLTNDKLQAMIEGQNDEEDDDDDEDEDMDEEDDDEEEENEPLPPVKKRKVEKSQDGGKGKKVANENSKPKKDADSGKKKKMEQTPIKEPKTPLQQKQNKTPLSSKKSPKTYASMEELAAAIKKYPGGKPKKEEKFTNWIKSTFHVDNHEWIKKLWKTHKADMGL